MRTPIPKKLRFEVFKRDSFKCQYCGKSAPEVVLHVDHIKPVAEGGTDEITNLITACDDCNLGKGARKLDDSSVVVKQKKALDELNARREQLKMMALWREELKKLSAEEVSYIEKEFNSYTKSSFSEFGKTKIAKAIKQYGFENVMKNTTKACELRCLHSDNNEDIFDYILKLCRIDKEAEKNPAIVQIYYIRGIVKNRFRNANSKTAIILLKEAVENGCLIEVLKEIALKSVNWSAWKEDMQDYIEDAKQYPTDDELKEILSK